MTQKMKSVSSTYPTGKLPEINGSVGQTPPEPGELKITQDIGPSGLGLMPSGMARRIAQMVSRHASNHA
ncbi:MAG: hypothetical protein WBV85_11805 [Solirubrobacteraceae bacterium]